MTLHDQDFRFVKRGTTKMMEPAGEYPAITAEFINKHVHPSQAAKLCRADWSGKDESSVETVHPEVIKLLHAYVDADRAMHDATRSFVQWDSDLESLYAPGGFLNEEPSNAPSSAAPQQSGGMNG